MTHANEDHDSYSLKHDTTSKIPSKHSQPPIAADTMAWLDYDTRTRLVKKYRTQLASGPSTVVAVLAGVSTYPRPHLAELPADSVSRFGCHYLLNHQSPFENIKTRMQSYAKIDIREVRQWLTVTGNISKMDGKLSSTLTRPKASVAFGQVREWQ